MSAHEQSNRGVSLEYPQPQQGIGAWPGGVESWPTGVQYDKNLLAEGDTRNVVDRYRYWSVDAIRADLDTTRIPLHIAIENWEHDFNIGSMVRTANAFNVAGVHIVGRRRWNRRGAMVTDRYLHIYHHPDVPDLCRWAKEAEHLPIIGIDNVPGSVAIETFSFPDPCLLFFGSESYGLSDAAQVLCAQVVAITQHGSTRSMNAGAAAAIAMYAWRQQH